MQEQVLRSYGKKDFFLGGGGGGCLIVRALSLYRLQRGSAHFFAQFPSAVRVASSPLPSAQACPKKE